ncbi:hypothetical protein J437_LFUL006238 [Ladona fulva]|uniref:PiggyBac transposable element-derived protein domain-containing protein n=1 Tax=Ladona fulva TaxID=123851 RepID=A0A8K0K4M5_LADFU|nr:hypothetical protein J437_LFUL006238 [Ladona fulva]
MISTMHHDTSIDSSTQRQKKPDIVTFYNSTKGGVDTVDKMCGSYNTARNTRRWPLAIFYHLLNTIGINSFILHKNIFPESNMNRRKFLREISRDLTRPFISRRSSLPRLPSELRKKIEKHGETSQLQGMERKRKGSSGRCSVCPRKKDKNTNIL